MRFLSTIIIGTLLAIPLTAAAAELPKEMEVTLRANVFQWINEARRMENLPPLHYNSNIEVVAAAHASDTAVSFDPMSLESREQTYLAHTSSNGKNLEQRFTAQNVLSGWGFAENTGYWIRDPFIQILKDASYGLRLIHDGMMAEVPPNDSHRENLLGPYTDIGIGLSLLNSPRESLNAIFLVTDFSRYSSEEEEIAFRESQGHIPTSTRSLVNPELTPTHGGPFLDVRPDHPFAMAIDAMKGRDILRGYDDGTFQPEKTVSRAELTKMMLVAIDVSPIGLEFNECFRDVFNQWFAPYACLAKRKGWITGYEDGSFRPTQEISRAEGLTLITRIFSLTRNAEAAVNNFIDVPPGAWFQEPTLAMTEHKLLPFEGNSLHPERGLTRGEVAEILYRAMEREIHAPLPGAEKPTGASRNLHEEMPE
ncbi:MAG TPA: S-layer homology domain-containing protein [Candidatus Peribacterales bacterium]|nr:S-layer homology domain-containing protein [Candidatus Peribacterales bacterium]